MKQAETAKLDTIIESRRNGTHKIITSNIKSFNERIRISVYDNSYWDDMVRLVKTGDNKWAYENIYYTMEKFDIDAEYILDSNFNTIIALKDKLGIVKDTLPLRKDYLASAFAKDKFASFFVETKEGLLELYSAPIQPSKDNNRTSPPQGYLLAGIFWNDSLLLQLARQTGGTYTLENSAAIQSNLHNPSKPSTILNIIPLKGWNNQPVKYLYSVHKIELIDNFFNLYNSQVLLLLLFSMLILGAVSLFLFNQVLKPINILYTSITNNDENQLDLLKKDRSEFSKLASTLTKFFIQKKDLVQEIEKREIIENELEETVKFENMISTISSIFINISLPEIQAALNNSLSEIGSFLNIDRAYIFTYDGNKEILYSSSFWRRASIEENRQSVLSLHLSEFKWLQEILHTLEPVVIEDTEKLPPAIKFKKDFIQKQNVKSLLMVPLFQGNEIYGFVGFDTIKQHRKFTGSEIKFAQNVGNVLSNAIERKSNEEKVSKANIILENSTTILIEWKNTPDLPISYVSENISSLGYSSQELVKNKTRYKAIVYPYDYEKVIMGIAEFLNKSKEELRQEYRLISKDKKIVWVECRLNSRKDENNEVVCLEGTLTNITDKKKIEEVLKQSEYNYRSVVNSVKEVIFKTDKSLNWVFLNPAWTEITGFSTIESLGREIIEFIHPDDKEKANRMFTILFNNGNEHCKETIKFITKDGTFKWIEIHLRLILVAQKNIMGTSGTLRDVTDLVSSEEAMKIKDKAIHSSHNGVLIFDAISKGFPIVFANPAFYKMTGYNHNEVIGKSINFLYGPNTSHSSIELIEEAFSSGIGCEVVLKCHTKNGNIFWNELKVSPIKDKEEIVTNFVVILSDVSARINSEEEIKKALEQEKELNKLKSRFVSIISHEFRTPLTTIFSSTELLERYAYKWSEEKRQEHLDRIKKSTHILDDMISFILTANKAESGRLVPAPTRINLIDFCRGIVNEYQAFSGDKYNIVFNYNNFDNEVFEIDEIFLRQIISNLLSNAIKYSPDGGDIKFDLSVNDSYISIVIKDNGIGIPETDRPKIFEMFNRAENVGSINGTGIGLSIVNKTVETLGGTISFDSTLNKGTTFNIQIPVINRGNSFEKDSNN
jgi:PAS domain S-box-containing protein